MATPSDLAIARAACQSYFRAAVAAVDPAQLVASRLERDRDHGILHIGSEHVRRRLPWAVVGAGKPAAAMAAGAGVALGEAGIGGVVVTADGCQRDVPGVAVRCAGHPLPDERGAAATREIVAVASGARQGLLFLLGGGASSLLVQPSPPLQLAHKLATTQLLLDCGAAITEINTVRKHLSSVKGGGLLRIAGGEVSTLALSDVVGGDPATIGSGPTVADPTTFADAHAVLDRYALLERVPGPVRTRITAGMRGAVEETVEPGAPAARRSRYEVVGDNESACEAAAARARADGNEVVVEGTALCGDTTAVARAFAARLRTATAGCRIAGGETTVQVRGRGRGGRNQEFALVLAEEIAGSDWVVLSAGTDGVDGPTDAAGAYVDGSTLARARERGLDTGAALRDNDSHGFFAALGDLFCPGPTGTNVMDVKIAVRCRQGGG